MPSNNQQSSSGFTETSNGPSGASGNDSVDDSMRRVPGVSTAVCSTAQVLGGATGSFYMRTASSITRVPSSCSLTMYRMEWSSNCIGA